MNRSGWSFNAGRRQSRSTTGRFLQFQVQTQLRIPVQDRGQASQTRVFAQGNGGLVRQVRIMDQDDVPRFVQPQIGFRPADTVVHQVMKTTVTVVRCVGTGTSMTDNSKRRLIQRTPPSCSSNN